MLANDEIPPEATRRRMDAALRKALCTPAKRPVPNKPGSVGLPFAGMDVELRGADGAVAAAGEVGELFCRGRYTFNGYFERASETAEAIVDGWVTVGDMAVRDGDGLNHDRRSQEGHGRHRRHQRLPA